VAAGPPDRALARPLGPVKPAAPRAETTAEVVAELLGARRVAVLDVGARWGAGGAWWSVPPLAHCIGFEPDADECARLQAELGPGAAQRYVPVALGRATGEGVLHVTEDPACSSLHPPDEALPARYPDLAAMRTVRTARVPLVSIDAWADADGVRDVAFVKLDTQGSELDILRGAARVLDGCVALEVEVEFSPLYRGVPVFADVDTFMRQNGFALWRLESLCHYAEAPTRADRTDRVHFGGVDAEHPIGSGRLYWGNALYFRDYTALAAETKADAERLLVLAAFLSASGDRAAASAAIRRACRVAGAPGRDRLEAHAALLLAPPAAPAAPEKIARRRRWWRRAPRTAPPRG